MPTPRFPAPLGPGDRIAVTAPSSGVEPRLHARLDLVIDHLRQQGFEVIEGECLREHRQDASAPAAQRASELMGFLLRDDVAAVYPPWGGELAIELLDHLDWAALRDAKPKWLIGYSDTSTLLVPLALLGWATAHGPGLMDLAPAQQDELTRHALAHLATPAGGSFTQHASTHWQREWTDFAVDPACAHRLTEPTRWRCINRDDGINLTVRGRLIGGCVDTLMHLAASAHGNVPGFIRRHAGDGVLLYLENAEQSPTALVRALRGLRWAGWFDGLSALLIGRSAAPTPKGEARLGDAAAVLQVVGDLPCPVLVDLDIGHRPPQLVLINGALAELHLHADGRGFVTQQLL